MPVLSIKQGLLSYVTTPAWYIRLFAVHFLRCFCGLQTVSSIRFIMWSW